jgi:catechol 2,3-dioxygenase-like lactoylglutathione lyase family enzyme
MAKNGPTSSPTVGLVLHHLTLWVPDLPRAHESWSWLLGELGYAHDGSFDNVALFRHDGRFAIALEQSPDTMPSDRHPIAGGAHVAYLEDRDGFEVELVSPSPD